MTSPVTTCLLLCLLAAGSGLRCQGQARYERFDYLVINDSPVLEKLTAQLRSTGVVTFLIYQTTRKATRVAASVSPDSTEELTFLAWATPAAAHARLITADSLYQPHKISTLLFAYPQRFTCGVLPIECDVKFVAPLFSPTTNDLVAYHEPGVTFYFESPPAHSYTGSPVRDLARARWLALIKAALLPLCSASQPAVPYERPALTTQTNYKPNLFSRKKRTQ